MIFYNQLVESEQRFTLSIGYFFCGCDKSNGKVHFGVQSRDSLSRQPELEGVSHTAPAVRRQREMDAGAWLLFLYIHSGASALERQLIS